MPLAYRTCLPSERQQGRLKSVLGVVHVAQHPAADAPNHRPVPPDEQLEGGLITLCHESLQQVRVASAVARRANDSAQMADGLCKRMSHLSCLLGDCFYCYRGRSPWLGFPGKRAARAILECSLLFPWFLGYSHL